MELANIIYYLATRICRICLQPTCAKSLISSHNLFFPLVLSYSGSDLIIKMEDNTNFHAAEPSASRLSVVDSDMVDEKGMPLMCNNIMSEDIPLSQLNNASKGVSKESPARAKTATKNAYISPEELYAQIEKSRDKLFFIAYAAQGDTNEDGREKWYLVRVDLDTCNDVEEAQNCDTTGRYYVEFYTKSLDDQNKPDVQSRWWMIWNSFSYKRGDMIIGNAREFDPNNKAAIKRRLVDLSKKMNPGNSRPEFQANLEKYTTYSDFVNLADPKIRLVGPFDFEQVQKHHINDNVDLGGVSPDDVYVRDRVPLSRWVDLTNALGGRNFTLPTIANTKSGKKRKSSDSEKKLPRSRIKPACHECAKVEPSSEMLIFDKTSALSKLCIHKACGLQTSLGNGTMARRTLISTNEVTELVQKTLSSIRNAATADGETFCVMNELKEELNRNLDAAMQSSSEAAARPRFPDVYPETDFDQDEVNNMPTVYGYFTRDDDPSGTSEMNAKIAKLDYDVTRRREKRLAKESAKETNILAAGVSSHTADVLARIVSVAKRRDSTDSEGPKKVARTTELVGEESSKESRSALSEPAQPYLNIPNLPRGWIMRRIPRTGSNSVSSHAHSSPLQ